MKKTVQYYFVTLLATVSCSAAGSDADSIQNEIETFFSSGLGSIAFALLLFLALLWLMLPLAVFGLKSKLKDLIEENTRTNSILTELRNDFAALTLEEMNTSGPAQAEIHSDEGHTDELKQENADLSHQTEETNRLLAEIRDILAALNVEETPEADTGQSDGTAEPEMTAELYNEVKFDP